VDFARVQRHARRVFPHQRNRLGTENSFLFKNFQTTTILGLWK
jgi:hypothetical protein